MRKLILLVSLLLPVAGFAQSYSIDWYKVAGGGGVSVGGAYQISGTTGQPDAGGSMSGVGFSLTGGFWSLISLMQTAGVPNLFIITNGPNSVKVFWPNTGIYTLQQNSNLSSPAGWTTSVYPVTTNSPAGSNSITITPPVGHLFFRLAKP